MNDNGVFVYNIMLNTGERINGIPFDLCPANGQYLTEEELEELRGYSN